MLRLSLAGSAYVGVFAHATDEHLVVRPGLDGATVPEMEAELGVEAVETTVGGSGTVGALAAGNGYGTVVSGRATDRETERIATETSGSVRRLPGKINAAGNVVLANDTGAYVHPNLKDDAVNVVRETLDVPVERGMLADVPTVGAAAVATNKGVLCHPESREPELEVLEDHLGVPADLGTINYGAPLIGSGLIANGEGYVVGDETTGPELGRIDDALGFVG